MSATCNGHLQVHSRNHLPVVFDWIEVFIFVVQRWKYVINFHSLETMKTFAAAQIYTVHQHSYNCQL